MKEHDRIRAEISLDAVKYNFEQMRQNLTPGTKMAAVIKADAYGHGAMRIAGLVEPWPYIWGFAVATAEEALRLRDGGVKKPVLILGPVFDEDLEDLARRQVRLTIMDEERARRYAAAAAACGGEAVIHLAVDTGMSRIGLPDTAEGAETAARIAAIPGIKVEGLFTHFARADETDVSPARRQLQRYLDFSGRLEALGLRIPLHHCSNSAGIIRMQEANLDMVRAGITIYGIFPSDEVEKDIISLKPVMSLVSHVSYVKEVPEGTEVSYGGTFTAKRPTRLATIPAGYADGYPRLLSNKGCVLIRGMRAPICGRVCMDQFMVDVTDIPGVKTGDRVVLLGKDGEEQITAEELGSLSGRFPYELVCDISPRVPRVYID